MTIAEQKKTRMTAAGVLVAGGAGLTVGEIPDPVSKPTQAPYIVSAAPNPAAMVTPNSLYLAAVSLPIIGGSAAPTGGAPAARGSSSFSVGSGASTSPSSFSTLAADPASANAAFAPTAATLVGPADLGSLIGGLIGIFVRDGTEDNPNAGLLMGNGGAGGNGSTNDGNDGSDG